MRPIDELAASTAKDLLGVFTDIDDTLTEDGKLGAEAYLALWRLRAAGLWVVPVTGRPAGWCDLIARQWPVDGVVGENGALAFWERDRRLERMFHPAVADPAVRARLDKVRERVLAEVPFSRVAKDQAYRMFDLAIDFAEEPPDLGLTGAEQIRAVFEAHGARAKVSSIHVNGWFGDYDKLSMTRLFAEQVLGVDLAHERSRFIFVGDSPNDEPMFAFFPNSCAVANIAPFVSKLAHRPAWLTQGRGGSGFAELAEVLLRLRGV